MFVQAEQGDLACASDSIFSAPSVASIVSVLSSIVLTSECECCKLRIDGDEQEGD